MAEGHYEVYTEYAKSLRTWLVAYGIGGPVLFLTQSQIADKIAKSGEAGCIVKLFLGGAAAQIFLALLNKYVNWYFYWAGDQKDFEGTPVWEILAWVSRAFWIDIALDVAAIVMFGLATYRVLCIFGCT